LSREKRRKVSSAENDPLFSFFSVQPILLALEYSLKADAQDRNNWIVADEGRMYHMLLKPLSKLLLANIPDFFPVQSNLSQQDATISTRYRELVCGSGTEGYGSVIGCLTALALAGGNEVLWKPLNHAILEACSNEDRSEVRKAGIRSLLSIIQALGEEYMVLLPECLPVLSELLEDQDNEIVEMTRRCIQIGEELLGESLF
jgi:U3 small nucleolar RNA-associated protein 10